MPVSSFSQIYDVQGANNLPRPPTTTCVFTPGSRQVDSLTPEDCFLLRVQSNLLEGCQNCLNISAPTEIIICPQITCLPSSISCPRTFVDIIPSPTRGWLCLWSQKDSCYRFDVMVLSRRLNKFHSSFMNYVSIATFTLNFFSGAQGA